MSARYVYAVVAILTLAAGYACWCRAPLIWDGAYQFNATLIMQRPYFYLTRFHTFFLWWPTVWASRLTSNVTLLQTVYGLPFLLAPALAVLLSWWMVHKDAPYLIIWVIFGAAAGSLPGQIFVINDSIFQQHLFWPIFMGLFVPLSVPKKIVLGILTILQFVHPLGVMLFFGAAVAALGVGFIKSDQRVKHSILFVVGVGLFAAGVAGILRRFDVSTEQQTTGLLLSVCIIGLLAIMPASGWHRFVRLPASALILAITAASFFIPIPMTERRNLLVILVAITLALALAPTSDHPRMFIRAAVMVALFLLAASKIFITNRIPALYDNYAADEAKWSTAIDRWTVGVRGWPLHGLWFMWSAAAMLILWVRWRGRLSEFGTKAVSIMLGLALAIMAWEYRHDIGQATFSAAACVAFYLFLLQFRRDSGPSPTAGILPLLCAAAGAVCFIHWAGDGRLWWKAIDYRRWVGPLTAPFFLFAMLDAFAAAAERNAFKRAGKGRGFEVLPDPTEPQTVRPRNVEPPRRSLREPLALLLAVTFAMVIFLQCTAWHAISAQLMRAVQRYPGTIVPESAVPWISETPLDHWATADYVMAMQGKTPAKLLLSPIAEEHIYDSPPKFPHWDFYPHATDNHPDATPGPVGWFDLRPLLARLNQEPRPKEITGPRRFDAKTTPE